MASFGRFEADAVRRDILDPFLGRARDCADDLGVVLDFVPDFDAISGSSASFEMRQNHEVELLFP